MPGGLLDMFGIDPVANRQRRDRGAEIDKQIAGELARTKLAGQLQIDATKVGGAENRLTQAEKAKFDAILQQMVNDGQMSIEQARVAGQLANTREGGNQARKTQAESAAHAKDLENTTAGNSRTRDILQQQLGILGKSGVPFSAENLGVYDKALTDPRIQNELQNVQQMTAARNVPAFATTLAQGMQAQNLAPAFANMQAGKIAAGPGDMLAVPPSGIELPPTDLNAWGGIQGGGQQQSIQQVPAGIPGLPPITEVLNNTVPGRIKVNPSLMQQAQQIAPAPAPAPDPIAQSLKQLRLPATANNVIPGPAKPAIPRGYEQYADALQGSLPGTGNVDNTERMAKYRLEMMRRAMQAQQQRQQTNSMQLMMP